MNAPTEPFWDFLLKNLYVWKRGTLGHVILLTSRCPQCQVSAWGTPIVSWQMVSLFCSSVNHFSKLWTFENLNFVFKKKKTPLAPWTSLPSGAIKSMLLNPWSTSKVGIFYENSNNSTCQVRSFLFLWFTVKVKLLMTLHILQLII